MGCVYDLYCAALAPQKSQSRLERGKKVEKATNAFCAGFSRASDEARRCLLAISGSRPHPVPHPHLPSAYSLLSDVQTSLIFYFTEPQPYSASPPPSLGHLLVACCQMCKHLFPWTSAFLPSFTVGPVPHPHLPWAICWNRVLQKNYLQNPVPHPHRWPSAYISLSDVPCVCKHLQDLITVTCLEEPSCLP